MNFKISITVAAISLAVFAFLIHSTSDVQQCILSLLESNFEQNFPSSIRMPRMDTLHYPNLRLLAPEQTTKKEKAAKKSSKVSLIIMLVFLVVMIVCSLTFCIGCIIWVILKSRNRSRNDGKVTNISLGYDFIFPTLAYKLFKSHVGEPLQDSCVICLEQFHSTTKPEEEQRQGLYFTPNQDSQNGQKYDQESFDHPIQKAQRTKVLVKFTMCGHLLHDKCLNNWLERQENCPLCRQSFEVENFERWQKELGIDFQMQFQRSTRKKNNRRKRSEIKKPNNIRIQAIKSEEKNIDTEQQSEKVELSPRETYAIYVYSKIMKYHKDKIQHREELRLQERQSAQQSLMSDPAILPDKDEPSQMKMIGNSWRKGIRDKKTARERFQQMGQL